MNNRSEFLQKGLERLFQSTDELGFWDEKNQRIHAKLLHDENWKWRVDTQHPNHRYGVFTLTAVLLAKDVNGLDTEQWDDKIIGYLNYLKGRIQNFSRPELTYGGFSSLALGQKLYPQLNLNDILQKAFHRLEELVPEITDNHDALMLIGATSYLDGLKKEGHQKQYDQAHDYFKARVGRMIKVQDKHGIFHTGDLRACYLQRILYPLWGLALISKHFYRDEIRQAIETAIEMIWRNRRDQKDDGLIWHPAVYWVRSKRGWKVPMISPFSPGHLMECHQTFFANAIQLYQHVFETNRFGQYSENALAWTFGRNRINKSLVDNTGLDFPSRIMELNGNVFVPGEKFKGSYELGSYILALSKNNGDKETDHHKATVSQGHT